MMTGTNGSLRLSLTPCGLLGVLVVPSARPGIGTYMLRGWYHMHIFDPTLHQEVCSRVGAGNAIFFALEAFQISFFHHQKYLKKKVFITSKHDSKSTKF